MVILRHYHKPDLFITFTCISLWSEIQSCLDRYQTTASRPDIVVRFFRLKLKSLLHELLRQGFVRLKLFNRFVQVFHFFSVPEIFGKVVTYIHVIQYQKRGLPHAHILLLLANQDRLRNSSDIDKWVSAEIPAPAFFFTEEDKQR